MTHAIEFFFCEQILATWRLCGRRPTGSRAQVVLPTAVYSRPSVSPRFPVALRAAGQRQHAPVGGGGTSGWGARHAASPARGTAAAAARVQVTGAGAGGADASVDATRQAGPVVTHRLAVATRCTGAGCSGAMVLVSGGPVDENGG